VCVGCVCGGRGRRPRAGGYEAMGEGSKRVPPPIPDLHVQCACLRTQPAPPPGNGVSTTSWKTKASPLRPSPHVRYYCNAPNPDPLPSAHHELEDEGLPAAVEARVHAPRVRRVAPKHVACGGAALRAGGVAPGRTRGTCGAHSLCGPPQPPVPSAAPLAGALVHAAHRSSTSTPAPQPEPLPLPVPPSFPPNAAPTRRVPDERDRGRVVGHAPVQRAHADPMLPSRVGQRPVAHALERRHRAGHSADLRIMGKGGLGWVGLGWVGMGWVG
jgi:hypothetical protein